MIFTNRKRHPLRSLGTVTIKDGKKKKALDIIFRILGGMKAKRPMNFREIFSRFIGNISPILSVRPYKRSGLTIRVPFKVYPGYENYLGLQMLRVNARRRSMYHAFDQYYREAVESFLGTSATAHQVNSLFIEAMRNRRFMRRRRRRK